MKSCTSKQAQINGSCAYSVILINFDPVGGGDSVGAANTGTSMDIRIYERHRRQAEFKELAAVVVVLGFKIIVETLGETV